MLIERRTRSKDDVPHVDYVSITDSTSEYGAEDAAAVLSIPIHAYPAAMQRYVEKEALEAVFGPMQETTLVRMRISTWVSLSSAITLLYEVYSKMSRQFRVGNAVVLTGTTSTIGCDPWFKATVDSIKSYGIITKIRYRDGFPFSADVDFGDDRRAVVDTMQLRHYLAPYAPDTTRRATAYEVAAFRNAAAAQLCGVPKCAVIMRIQSDTPYLTGVVTAGDNLLVAELKIGHEKISILNSVE